MFFDPPQTEYKPPSLLRWSFALLDLIGKAYPADFDGVADICAGKIEEAYRNSWLLGVIWAWACIASDLQLFPQQGSPRLVQALWQQWRRTHVAPQSRVPNRVQRWLRPIRNWDSPLNSQHVVTMLIIAGLLISLLPSFTSTVKNSTSTSSHLLTTPELHNTTSPNQTHGLAAVASSPTPASSDPAWVGVSMPKTSGLAVVAPSSTALPSNVYLPQVNGLASAAPSLTAVPSGANVSQGNSLAAVAPSPTALPSHIYLPQVNGLVSAAPSPIAVPSGASGLQVNGLAAVAPSPTPASSGANVSEGNNLAVVAPSSTSISLGPISSGVNPSESDSRTISLFLQKRLVPEQGLSSTLFLVFLMLSVIVSIFPFIKKLFAQKGSDDPASIVITINVRLSRRKHQQSRFVSSRVSKTQNRDNSNRKTAS